MKTIIFVLLIASTIFISKNTIAQSIIAKSDSTEILIGVFKSIPKELQWKSGCSYYISKEDEKNNNYIFVDDMGFIAYMKINGKMERFQCLHNKGNDSTEYYKSKNYEIKVVTYKTWEKGYEWMGVEGSITITDKFGNKKEQYFIGSCGC